MTRLEVFQQALLKLKVLEQRFPGRSLIAAREIEDLDADTAESIHRASAEVMKIRAELSECSS